MTKWLACVVAAGIGCGSNRGGSGGGDGVTVNAPLAPDAVIAYRDGDGPWAIKTGAATPFTFGVSSGTYTVAITCPTSKAQGVDVYQLTVDDLQTLDYGRECRPINAMLSGRFLGNGTNGNQIGWGQEAGYYATATETSYMVATASGKHDLIATRGYGFPDRITIQRDILVPPNLQIDLDFAAPSGLMLEGHNITTFGTIAQEFVSAGGTRIALGIRDGLVFVVPEAAMMSGDLNVFYVSRQGAIDGLRDQTSTMYASRVPPASIAAKPRISDVPTVSATQAGDYVLLEATWTAQPDAALYRLSAGGWSAHVSPAVFDESGVLALPDLSAVPGWDPTLGVTPGFPSGVAWSVRSVTGAPIDELLRPFPSREGEIHATGWNGETP